jgi:protein-disulfide isomerase
MEHGELSFGIRDVALYVAVALLIGFGSGAGAALLLVRANRAVPSGEPATAETPSPTDTDWITGDGRPARGPADAPVTIVEFSDFQCPYCARFTQQTLPALEAKYGDVVRFVARHFPVDQLHPLARQAAEAAECANEQGAFWAYRRLLYERQRGLDAAGLKAIAVEANLDGDAFEECLDSGRTADIVDRDLQDGLRAGVRGTPTSFVNGRPVIGAVPPEVFESFIEAALAAKAR